MNTPNNTYTDFLTSTTSFKIGAGSIFNLAGNYFEFNASPSEAEADLRALRCDWEMVGRDLNSAIASFKLEAHPARINEYTSLEEWASKEG